MQNYSIQKYFELLIFIVVIGGLVYGLYIESWVVTFFLAVFGLLFFADLLWKVLENNRMEEEDRKIFKEIWNSISEKTIKEDKK